MKFSYDTLAIEVTRRCNMCCDHCMRGDAENTDISDEILDKALANTSSIGSLVLAGGEPSIAEDRILKVVETLHKYSVPVSSFYVVTNGKVVSDAFMDAMLKLYLYVMETGCCDEECNGLALSIDNFHESIPRDNIQKLSAFSFFRPDDKKVDFQRSLLLRLGRAKDVEGDTRYSFRDVYRSRELPVEVFNGVLCLDDEPITLTVNGNYLNGCDYEYQQEAELTLGSVFDHSAYERNLLRSATAVA